MFQSCSAFNRVHNINIIHPFPTWRRKCSGFDILCCMKYARRRPASCTTVKIIALYRLQNSFMSHIRCLLRDLSYLSPSYDYLNNIWYTLKIAELMTQLIQLSLSLSHTSPTLSVSVLALLKHQLHQNKTLDSDSLIKYGATLLQRYKLNKIQNP